MPTKISRRVSRISSSATKEMALIAARVGGCVSLGQGVPSFPTPPHMVEAVCRFIREDPSSGRYTLQPGLPALRRAIAEHIREDKKIDYDPETEIGVTVGAMEGLLAAILTVVDPGDEVILPTPGYASHIEQILLAEGVPVFAPLRTGDWSLDPLAVGRAVTGKTKAIILCNPGNPTGAVFSDEAVRAVADLARKHDLVIIADETYDFLVYDGERPLAPASLDGLKDRVISVSSFSKKYAATGWRVGWLAAPARLMEQIMKVHDAAAICAPTPSQHAALAALTGPQEVAEIMRQKLSARRRLCCDRLDRLSRAFSYVRPRGAFYIMARYLFTAEPSAEVAVRLIREARVITIPGGSYGPGGEGHLRISYGGDENELNEAFDRVERWLETNKLA